MNTKIRKNRKDFHQSERTISDLAGATKKYTTSTILNKLYKELEINIFEAPELVEKNCQLIDEFRALPEIEFDLDVENSFVEFLSKNPKIIEASLCRKKRRGPALLPMERYRSTRISVYFSNIEMDLLGNLAIKENMSISAFLREKGLNQQQ